MTTSGEPPPELPPATRGNDPDATGDMSDVGVASATAEVSDGDGDGDGVGVSLGVGEGVGVGAAVWDGAVPAPADS
jgi:hypothetical protein